MTGPADPELLLARLERHAREQPDAVAYTFLRDRGEPETITFGRLAARVRTLAARLRELARSGERAVLLYPPGLEFVCGFLGCLAAGVIAVPAYPPRRNRKAERLHGILADCSPSVLLTAAEVRGTLTAEGMGAELPPVLTTDEIPIRPGAVFDVYPAGPGDVAFLQYTSGSTGTPRGVVVTHGNITHNEQAIQRAFSHDRTGAMPPVVVGWLPLFHDMGLIGNALQPLYVGFHAVLMSPVGFLQDPYRWLRAISDYRGTTAGGPNFAFDLCARTVQDRQKQTLDLSCLRVMYNGSEPVRGDTLDRFADAFAPCGFRPSAFLPCYGLAEATLFVTGGPAGSSPRRLWVDSAALEAGRAEPSEKPDGRQLVGSGRSADRTRIVVVEPVTRAMLPDRCVGEVWVRSPSVAAGYWNRPDETRSVFENYLATGEGPFLATGDLGFLDAGELFVTGRSKDLIVARGRNIYPQDVEAAVERALPFAGANSCAAFAVGGDGPEQLAVVVEADRPLVRAARAAAGGNGTAAAARDTLAAAVGRVRQAVGESFGVPVHAVAFVRPGSFPRTSSGKVQRGACRDGLTGDTLDLVHVWRVDDRSGPAPTPPASHPDDIRAVVTAAVARGLLAAGHTALQPLDPDTPLPATGIDSVAAAVVALEIEKAIGVPLSPDLVYQHQTINQLAAHVADRANRATGAGPVGHHPPPGARGVVVPDALGGSMADFANPTGRDLRGRVAAYAAWRGRRRGAAVWPFSRLARSPAAPSTSVAGEDGAARAYLNFGSQDYLGLARDPRVLRAAREAITEFGVHSAGSPVLLGTTAPMADLERTLAGAAGKEDCVVFPTGWAAGFGVVTGLARGHDTLVLDALSHRCLIEGAYHVTREPLLFRHNDLGHLRETLARTRGRDANNGLFVVAESLYSMDSDSPDLPALVRLVREFDGILILDVAHDFGATGRRGLGLLEQLDGTGLEVDVVMGSFSKTFAATGGFVAADGAVVDYLRGHTTSYVFSNAISPVQAAAALACCRIAFSEEGNGLRDHLRENAVALRAAMEGAGFRVGGAPSPIVPVFVGEERMARLTARQLDRNGLLANLVEYPAVPRGAARFRFQVMSTHTPDMSREAADLFARSCREASEHAVACGGLS